MPRAVNLLRGRSDLLPQQVHEDWQIRGSRLVRDFAFKDFDEAMRFARHVADGAVDYFRRPDMCISHFNDVTLIIENRHHAGITEAETRLAQKVDSILPPGARAPGESPSSPPRQPQPRA
jgi:4a-hydroxytetrahydrobiopterin dehydratase